MTTNSTSNNPETPGQTSTVSDPPGQTSNPQNQTVSGQKTSIDTLPPDIQDYIARLRSEAEEANKKSRAEAKAKQAAEEQRLKEQGEFKALAEKHEARVKELEPKVAQLEALAEKVKKQIQLGSKDWPTEVKAFYPGDDAEISQLQDWYDRSGPLVEKLQQSQARASNRGNGPNPQPVTNPSAIDHQRHTNNLRASGKYGA